MNEAREFFIRESIAHARALNVAHAVLFIRGLLESCDDNDAVVRLRAIYTALSESDRQLELIQSGQLKLNFDQPKTEGDWR